MVKAELSRLQKENEMLLGQREIDKVGQSAEPLKEEYSKKVKCYSVE